MHRVGLDLGGSSVGVGVVNEDDGIISYSAVPAEAGRPAEQVIATMAQAVNTVLEQAGIRVEDCAGIGVGAPGTCDEKNGVVYRSYSMDWTDLPLANMLKEYFPVPVLVDNDANCAALAEVKAGAVFHPTARLLRQRGIKQILLRQRWLCHRGFALIPHRKRG